MATIRGKGGSPSHWYRPASQYDDATLAQKREYWRTKKREQRARQSERGKKPARSSLKKRLQETAPAVLNPALSGRCASSPPLQRSLQSHRAAAASPASQGGGQAGDATANRKEKWLHTMKLSKVLPSCSISAIVAEADTAAVRCLKVTGGVSRGRSSAGPAARPALSSSSVPPGGMNRMTNGSFAKAAPQPRVSMQGAAVHTPPPHTHRAPQRPHPPTNVTTGVVTGSSSEDGAANPTPQGGANSALVNSARAKGGSLARPGLESEEDRAARRREHWRIKKREQRAKQAARKARARERMDNVELTSERQTAKVQKLPGPALVRASLSATRMKSHKPQTGQAHFDVNQPTDRMRSEHQYEHQLTQSVILPDFNPEKNPEGTSPKLQSYVHLSAVIRGIARCKTPRQRCMEAQKNLTGQRNTRGKFLSLASVHSSRSSLKINPNDTPEQIVAKRREHWRIKKREQRAKLSVETRARLKAKDSHMQRVRRYQKILEEMRRARVVGQPSGSPLTHASETIGGFIKEDGTVTTNIPQVSTAHTAAAHHGEEARQQSDPQARTSQAICVEPPPIHATQGKVYFPPAGLSVHKPPRLLPAQTRPESTNAPVLKAQSATPSAAQLTLTHLQSSRGAAGPTADRSPGGCVMKMAVWSGVPTHSAPGSDTKLSEEERMAKKREYWRVKKREQRAARAARLKQGGLQTRAASALHKWKSPGHVTAGSASRTRHGGGTQTLPNRCTAGAPLARVVKEEQESLPAADLHSPPEQTLCPDVKPLPRPASPPPPLPAPPAPQPDADPALSADSQATTLLAVASMKKLLEESLSTVTHCKQELTDTKTDTTADQSEEDTKPSLTQLFFERDDLTCDAVDETPQVKGGQAEAGAMVSAASPDAHPDAAPPLCTSDEVASHPTCDHSSQTCSNFILKPCVEASEGPPSPLGARPGSPEPAKPHPEHQHCEQQRQAQEYGQNSSSVAAQRSDCCLMGPRELSSLQKKREYWKLLKRQQRARLKARREGERSRQPSAPRLLLMNTGKDVSPPVKPALLPKPSIASLTAVTCIPSVLVVSPTTCGAKPDTLQVKRPVTTQQSSSGSGPSHTLSRPAGATEPQQQATPLLAKWTPRSTEVDSVPSLPTLTPPDNPLSSINLHPIEPLAPTNSTLGPVRVPQSPTQVVAPAAKLVPLSTMVPPKPIPGESEEDFLKRKREYWRVKKKEQRARKAFREKGMTSRRPSNTWRPILPAQELLTEESCEWVKSDPVDEESDRAGSNSRGAAAGAFPYSDFTAPVEEESELLFADYKDPEEDPVSEDPVSEDPVSEAVWRNRYLMDYDPLNQLLVCMVCGELQYSHSLEGVRAHIDEAHPDTISLEPTERQRILEAWDEQVSQRERFFTSQLRQHSSALAGADGS